MYNQCQVHCYPGTADEVLEHTKHDVNKVRAVSKDPWKDYPMIVKYPDIIKSPVPMAVTVKQIENVLLKQSKAAYHNDNDDNNNNNKNEAPYTQQMLMMRHLNCTRIFAYATIRTTTMWTRWHKIK